MENLTFKEVIANIKVGQVWDNGKKRVIYTDYGIMIDRVEEGDILDRFYIANEDKFKELKREVSLGEAMEQLKAGKRIESVETNTQYKMDKGQIYCKLEFSDLWIAYSSFFYEEILNKWLIID